MELNRQDAEGAKKDNNINALGDLVVELVER
jgi:hypothetical protein